MKRKLAALALHENDKRLAFGPKTFIFCGGWGGGGGGKCQCSLFLFKWAQLTVTAMEVHFIFRLVPSSLDARMNLSIQQSTLGRINRPVHGGGIFMSH